MYWTSSSGRIGINITKAQAGIGSHPGQCDADIKHLRAVPSIRRQLDKICPTELVNELSGYGAWDEHELTDHDQNLSRLLWIACGDIVDGNC